MNDVRSWYGPTGQPPLVVGPRVLYADTMSLEATLLETLRKIEALHAGTTFDGERDAAQRAAEQIRARIAVLRGTEREELRHYSLPDPWNRQLFVALCRRYGLKPFRERGRRSSTIQVRAPRTFHVKTLWPQFRSLSEQLEAHLNDVTNRVIREAIHNDVTEAPEAPDAKALPSPTAPPSTASAVRRDDGGAPT